MTNHPLIAPKPMPDPEQDTGRRASGKGNSSIKLLMVTTLLLISVIVITGHVIRQFLLG
ncbi:hypothetical protein [Shewanella atlantica]|uniref:hypothetical protein n=1 Tax=Shewanella atlantica TaxID=271099 RepID=UPI00163A593E|nr:hypothetical protein [Shewanella atlantica]